MMGLTMKGGDMTKTEHLLIKLAEECCEVGKVVSKSLIFGLDEYHPNDPNEETNRVKLKREINDLICICVMLNVSGVDTAIDGEYIKKHMAKVYKYMDYSRDKGILEE